MKIILSPISSYASLSLARLGDVLIINGDFLDLSGIPEGATLPASAVASPWISGPISRIDGELHITILFPQGGADAPHHMRYPAPIDVAIDGPIVLPA